MATGPSVARAKPSKTKTSPWKHGALMNDEMLGKLNRITFQYAYAMKSQYPKAWNEEDEKYMSFLRDTNSLVASTVMACCAGKMITGFTDSAPALQAYATTSETIKKYIKRFNGLVKGYAEFFLVVYLNEHQKRVYHDAVIDAGFEIVFEDRMGNEQKTITGYTKA